MDDLPLEIWIEIAKKDLNLWRIMANSWPQFDTFTKSLCGQKTLIDQFVTKTQNMDHLTLELCSGVSLCIWFTGNQSWYQNGQFHRDGDRPAVILANGTQQWYQNNWLHRDGDKPAAIYSNGTQEWYQNGKLHRDGDQPAVIYYNAIQSWYQNGQFIAQRQRDVN